MGRSGLRAAVVKNVKVTADTTAVSRQGTTMSIDIQTAAAIVGTGLSQIQGIIAATVSKIGATLPIIVTPAGQGLRARFHGPKGFAGDRRGHRNPCPTARAHHPHDHPTASRSR